jgi:DNA polymerase (family 10)
MENSEFAKIFWETAEMLELKGENPFKIRAYQKAARNIEGLSHNLEEVYRSGGLKALEEVPGIGESLAGHIEEIIKTGKFSKYNQLLKEFPKDFMKLIEIPGMGPKTAMLLYKKLNIDSVEKLEKAAKAGKLAGLPGFGEKKQKNILAGLELKEKVKGRFLLSEATQFAQALVSKLEKIAEVDRVLPAGSLRRQKETIGDIDILITSKKPEAVMNAFVKLPQVQRVLAKGPTKSSVVLKNGMQSDLRVVGPKSFGAAAHYFTGSKQHNILIREMAVKKGLKISEYGIFKGKKQIGGKTEEEIFRSVGLPFIPPELREGSGEIEAAKAGKLPKLIELADLRGDLQMHSEFSDGGNTIEELVEYAKKLGYQYIAITDHTVSTRVAGGQTEKEFKSELEHIDKLNSRLKDFRILKGVEVDILPDGTLDYKDAILAEVEVVIAAVHSRFKMSRPEMTKRIISALKNKYVNLLSHPTGRLIGKRAPYEVDLEEILKVAKDTGTHMELNAHPERLDLNDVHCRRAKELGIKIAIDTDAHSANSLNDIQYGVATARRGWLSASDVINTYPIDKLLKALYIKR